MKQIEHIEHSLHNLASPRRGHTFWGLILVLLLAGIFLWLKHGVWLTHPNDVALLDSPDCFKNYMTTAWHVAHDSSYVHYEGMNYPYGEHVLFTDNQPIISAALEWWNRHVFDIHDKTTGLINIFQVLSMLLGAGVIYLLLRKLHLPVWYATIAALGILFLSPQNNRFDVHFGLSHTWIFPLVLLLLCRYEERSSRRYQSLLIGILLFVAGQLHFYHFGVSALFLGIYTAYQILTDFRWTVVTKRVFHLIVMVVVPFALLNVWIHWSDFCPDRPANPFGFTTYIGYWEGIFLPYENFPVYRWIDDNIIKIRRIDGESQAYVGMVAFAFTLWVLFRRRFRLFDKEWDEAAYHRVHKRYLKGVFAAGFVLLLLGCGFPFAIPGMEWLVDYLGPFKQFRGLGRFTWSYYYVVNLLAFYVLWNKSSHYPVVESWRSEINALMLKLRHRDFRNLPLAHVKKWSLALVPLLVMGWEAYYFQHHKQLQLAPNPALKSTVDTPTDNWLDTVDFTKYQALMPLPYYHVGSENIWLDIYYPLFKKTQETAFQTAVPDMGVFMSRSPIGRMVKSMQWALEPGEKPEILGDFPDNRPIALMIEPAKWEEVKVKYAHLLAKAKKEYDGPDLKIMSLVPDSMRVYAQEHAQAIRTEASNSALLTLRNGWKSSDLNGRWMYYAGYDSLNDVKYHFQGAGADMGMMGDSVWLYRGPIPKGNYNVSLWIKVTEDMGMTHDIKLAQNRLADGKLINFRHEGLRFYLRSIVDGWALFDLSFTVYEDNSVTKIYLHKKAANARFWFDEVMIKPSDATVYKQTPGWVAKDNMWFRL